MNEGKLDQKEKIVDAIKETPELKVSKWMKSLGVATVSALATAMFALVIGNNQAEANALLVMAGGTAVGTILRGIYELTKKNKAVKMESFSEKVIKELFITEEKKFRDGHNIVVYVPLNSSAPKSIRTLNNKRGTVVRKTITNVMGKNTYDIEVDGKLFTGIPVEYLKKY